MTGLPLLIRKRSQIETLQPSPDGLVDMFRNISYIVRIEARHGDAAIAGEVDMPFFSEREALCRVQAGEAVRRTSINQRSRWFDERGYATNLNIPICLTI